MSFSNTLLLCEPQRNPCEPSRAELEDLALAIESRGTPCYRTFALDSPRVAADAENMSLFRTINTDKYVGGRGVAAGVARSEKRRGGRIACSALTCDHGEVRDLSSTGIKVHSKKKPKTAAGEEQELTLRAEDETVAIRARCMWVRVDDGCEFDSGWELVGADAALKRRLMQMAATAQATEGLSRGWSAMKWW